MSAAADQNQLVSLPLMILFGWKVVDRAHFRKWFTWQRFPSCLTIKLKFIFMIRSCESTRSNIVSDYKKKLVVYWSLFQGLHLLSFIQCLSSPTQVIAMLVISTHAIDQLLTPRPGRPIKVTHPLCYCCSEYRTFGSQPFVICFIFTIFSICSNIED